MHDLHHRHLYDHHHHQHQHDHWSVGRVVVVEGEWVSNTAVILHTHWVCRRGLGLISREYLVTTCHVTVFIPQTASSHVWLYKILPAYPPFWEVTILNCKIYAWVDPSPLFGHVNIFVGLLIGSSTNLIQYRRTPQWSFGDCDTFTSVAWHLGIVVGWKRGD